MTRADFINRSRFKNADVALVEVFINSQILNNTLIMIFFYFDMQV